jgi:hypothetical protein
VIDAVRCAKLAQDRGSAGARRAVEYFMKSPPQQFHDSEARERVRRFVIGEAGRASLRWRMATTFLLIRHAAHSRVHDTLCGRMPGVTLSEEGRRQAVGAAARGSAVGRGRGARVSGAARRGDGGGVRVPVTVRSGVRGV